MKTNLAIVHGGGPTCVINASLCGAVKRAKEWKEIRHVYGVLGGIGGLFEGKLACLEELPDTELEKFLYTPGSVLGTSRRTIANAEYALLYKKLKELDIGCLLLTGGNGTMNSSIKCGQL